MLDLAINAQEWLVLMEKGARGCRLIVIYKMWP